MKKRIGLLVCALTLTAAAFATGPAPAEAACFKPACFASPACCTARECTTWCNSTGGGAPMCQGAGMGQGGCCACGPIES